MSLILKEWRWCACHRIVLIFSQLRGRVDRLTAVMKTKNGIEFANATISAGNGRMVQVKGWRGLAPVLVRDLTLGSRVTISYLRRINAPRAFNSGTVDFELQLTPNSTILDHGPEQEVVDEPLISMEQVAATTGRFRK